MLPILFKSYVIIAGSIDIEYPVENSKIVSRCEFDPNNGLLLVTQALIMWALIAINKSLMRRITDKVSSAYPFVCGEWGISKHLCDKMDLSNSAIDSGQGESYYI